jgi:hypothetical protein
MMGNAFIDGDFPGGNVRVERVDGNDVHLHQDLRDTEGWWFYWAFRVRGAGGRTLRFHFTDRDPVGARGPAFSLDAGATWQWLNRDFSPAGFTFAFPPGGPEVRLAFGMVYTQTRGDRFLASLGRSPHLRAEPLATTRKGRPVERLLAGRLDGPPDHRVVVTARHHCCEMMASYTLEGLVTAVLADDATGRWLRAHVVFAVLPFMDKDGVEEGDQGKNRRPHDHNRDYGGRSVHAETSALRAWLPHWLDGRDALALDLHCPWIRGDQDEGVYQVGDADPAMWARQRRLGAILERVQSGALAYRVAHDLPFGASWNTDANTGTGTSFVRWAAALPGVRLATVFEIPYATANGCEVNAETARAFGWDLARAIVEYLRQPEA